MIRSGRKQPSLTGMLGSVTAMNSVRAPESSPVTDAVDRARNLRVRAREVADELVVA